MKNFMRKHPRLVGVILFLAGIGFVAMLKNSYETGSSIKSDMVIITPFILLYGLAITIQPRLLILKGEFRSAPLVYKLISGFLTVVGLGLGIYLRYVVFQDWQ